MKPRRANITSWLCASLCIAGIVCTAAAQENKSLDQELAASRVAIQKQQYDEAIRAFEKAIEAGYREDASSYNIACGYALKGERDRAFEWLRKAEEAGFRTDKYLSSDDDLDNLRSDPRFKAFRQEARQHRNEDARGEARQAVNKTLGGAKLYREISALDVAQLTQPFLEVADEWRRSRTPRRQKADSHNCLLSLGGERCGVEAAGQSAEERPPVHHSIT